MRARYIRTQFSGETFQRHSETGINRRRQKRTLRDRTTATCRWGVSDPLGNWRGTVIGGKRRGSLTPHLPPSLLPRAALTATRAAQSAAGFSAAKSLTTKDIDKTT